jgi:Domian of unknown function (DUF4952)
MWNAQLFWLVKIRLIYFVKKLFWSLKLLIMLGILWPIGGQSFSLATRPDVSQADCAKSSKVWRQPPKELKLTSCQVESGQLEILVVRYVVKGVDAAKVEKMLRQRFGMGKLRFVCCGWGSQNKKGSYRDQDGYNYDISMNSGETVEMNWRKIPEFEVVVSKFLTEP